MLLFEPGLQVQLLQVLTAGFASRVHKLGIGLNRASMYLINFRSSSSKSAAAGFTSRSTFFHINYDPTNLKYKLQYQQFLVLRLAATGIANSVMINSFTFEKWLTFS
jgi:hypothetical protein